MAGKGYPCHFLFICSTRIFFSTWMILSGPFLLMPVIHLRKCIANMNMIAIFGLLNISMNSMRGVISNCGQNMQMEK